MTQNQSSPGLRILVVDDNRSASFMLCVLLKKLGHDAREANAARAALATVESWQPDLVISDVGMPIMSGHDLAREIRSLSGIRQPHLVAVTGSGEEEDVRDALAAGFDRHFTKPVGLEHLQAMVAELGSPKT
jgi:CheY-like chemotaxis protein